MAMSTTARTPLRLFASLVSRAALAARLGWLFGGQRKIHEILGYKPQLSYLDFKARYLRQDLAHRIVRAYPDATWAQPPVVQEDDQDATDTPFEAAWKGQVSRLGVYSVLERTDLLANLGQYSVLLIGLRGQSVLSQPATPVKSPDDVLYLTPYSEEFAGIGAYDTNPGSPGFGQPSLYRINLGRGGTLPQGGYLASALMPSRIVEVHASRVLHVAEDLLDDEVFGIPRLEPLFDRLDDLLKVVGGSAEMFWQDAKRRLVFAMKDDYRLEDADEQALAQEVEEFTNELRNFVRVQGIDVKTISGEVASPDKHFGVLLDLIAATTGIPQRILMGNERGQLASTQDENAWLQRVSRRQTVFAEGRMIRPLVDRLLSLGALPPPAQPYTVTWSNLFALSEEQKAAVAKDYATALSLYAGPGNGPQVVPGAEFREQYLGLPAVPDVEPLPTPAAEEL
jgi:hypothetical protein